MGGQRRCRAAQAALRTPRRGGDRPHAPGRGRLEDHRGAALRGRDDPDHHDQRPRVGARQGARAAHRRRRLPRQAVRHARAGRAGRGGAAPLGHGAVGSRLGQGRGARPGGGRRSAPGASRRRGCRSHAHRVPAALGACGRVRQGAHPRSAAAAGVGHAVPVSRPHGGRVCAQAAPEARPALAVAHVHPDPPRGRVPVRSARADARCSNRGQARITACRRLSPGRRPEPAAPPAASCRRPGSTRRSRGRRTPRRCA